MSYFGDVGDFEYYNFGKMMQDLGENPERALYGSADPFSTSMWNGILGTDNKPLVDQWGGAAPQRYQEAEDAGINTGPGADMHGVARTIASFYAGGAAGNAMGGASTTGSTSASGMGSGTGFTGGGGIGFTGGSTGAASGMGGGGITGSVGTGFNASTPFMTAPASAPMTSSPGLLAQMKAGYDTVTPYVEAAKPYMDAVQTGMKVSDQMQGKKAPPLPPPQLTPVTPNQAFTGIMAQMQQKNALNTQEAEQRRMQRRSLIGGA